jgi:hypothetical protein
VKKNFIKEKCVFGNVVGKVEILRFRTGLPATKEKVSKK